MRRHVVSLMTGVLAIVALCVLPALATDVFQGQVLSAGSGKITLQAQNGQTSTFEVARDAQITRDGRQAKLDELKKTDSATVTTDNKMQATVIEARSGKVSFQPTSALAADRHEGTCVNAGNGKITMLDQDGKLQKTFRVADDAKITRDGKPVRLEDVQSGDALTITTERKLLRNVATAIDATTLD